MLKPLFASAVLLLLAGCAGEPAGKFDPTDACKLLPSEKVAQVAGIAVDRAVLSRATPAMADTAGFSQCDYTFIDGTVLQFFVRQSPVDDYSPQVIQRAKQGIVDNFDAKTADVTGLGDAAFTVDQMSQLHVFWAGNRYISFVAPVALKTQRPIGEVELALARAVVG